jgi:two-component system C4-dicarboxylate transport sensor histidine kinase DctB
MSKRMPTTDSLPPDPDGRAFERTARLAELGVLTASLVHELRQPLMAIKGSVQLAQHKGETVDAAALLGQLAHIEDLLDHYAGFGRVDEVLRRYDLRGPVHRGLRMLKHRLTQGRVELVVQLPEARIDTYGRPMAVQQVVVNLLQNALDAVRGRPERRIEVGLSVDGAFAELSVADSGEGIPQAVQATLFEPFVTSKPAGQGTGLGLHIARKLVEEVGGTLQLRTSSEGTCFTVRLPAVP